MQYLRRYEKKKSLASRMRHYVTFQKHLGSFQNDGEGGQYPIWTNVSGAVDIPAEILPITAKRKAEMNSYNVRATHYIRIRSNISVEEVGRVQWGSRYFVIHSVENVQERDFEQFIIAEEIRP